MLLEKHKALVLVVITFVVLDDVIAIVIIGWLQWFLLTWTSDVLLIMKYKYGKLRDDIILAHLRQRLKLLLLQSALQPLVGFGLLRDWNYKTHFAQEKYTIYWDWRELNPGPNCRRKLLQYLRTHVLSPDQRPSFPQMRMWVPSSLCPFEQRMWHSAPGGYLIPGGCPGQRTSLCSGSSRGSQPASLSAKSVKSHTIMWN